ncbi:MAG: MFS transporter [Candidatus Obscuribacterales bacterium]|nr:MFS transporter [Candidatus Obscuribacterales bacterium]
MNTTTVATRLERLPITNYQRVIFAVIATAWFFDCLDVAMMTFVLSTIKVEFSLSTAQAGFLASMSFIGMFIGAALSGVLADRYGRVVVFRISIIIWGLSSLACAFAPDLNTLMAYRVLLGVGMAMELPVGQALICEFVPARVRGKYVALLEGMWPVGFITAGILAMFVVPNYGWRGAFIIEAVPALFVLVIRRIVPESPRWLHDSGQVERANQVIESIEKNVMKHLDNAPQSNNDPIAPAEANPQPTHIDEQKESENYKTGPTRKLSISVLFQKEYGKRTAMLWILWFFALLGYYALTTWLGALLEAKGISFAKSTQYIVLISLAGIPGFFSAAWLVESWGRKPMMIVTLLASAICAFFYGTVDNTTVMIVFGLLMQFFLFGMWSVLYAYTPEIYPTHARATGSGFASSVGRLGALLGPSLIGWILPFGGQFGVFTMAAAALATAALAVYFLGEETKGKVLEEI